MNQFQDKEVGSVCMHCPGGKSKSEPAEKNPKHRIEIELVAEYTEEPIPGEEYCITLPDGIEVRGRLDPNGKARVSGIEDAGNCKITFPNLDKDAWERAQENS